MSAAQETIAAVASAPGRGAIGILRLSGGGVPAVLGRVFRPAREGDFVPGRLRLGDFLDPRGSVFDSGLAFFMPGPGSYTGEDYAELQCHGNPLILEKLLQSLLAAGARAAAPGEFTRRAFLNGKLDLTQCEGVDELIRAGSGAACGAAWRLQNGQLRRRLEPVSDLAARTLAGMQGAIEFGEDVPSAEAEWQGSLEKIVRELESLLAESGTAARVREGLRAVICGRPNAGKSSLFNALLRQERSLVTEIPGTTRDVLEGSLELGGLEIILKDTAGLRETADRVESLGVARTREAISGSDLVLWVADGTDSAALAEEPETAGLPVLKLQSRSDLRPEAAPGFLAFSAMTGEGLPEIREELRRQAAALCPGFESLVSLRARHVQLLEEALDNARRAREALASGAFAELAARDAEELVRCLGEVTGKVSSEDLLDLVFSEFCVGK